MLFVFNHSAALRLAEEIRYWKNQERELAFNGAGHYLHTVYFMGMSPDGGGKPKDALAGKIAAERVEGGGWTHLVWVPRSQRLEILQSGKTSKFDPVGRCPFIDIDMWEQLLLLEI